MNTSEHVLIAYDDSQAAERALAVGLDLAEKLQARVTLVTVLEPLPRCRDILRPAHARVISVRDIG